MYSDVASERVSKIDACLPQTQCTRCGYPDCRTYAEAIAAGTADINRCPPGGQTTVEALARLLAVVPKALDPDCGTHRGRRRAIIDEQTCIGCRKCIDACPVDAIVGARQLMHTVIATDCTGCELCLPPCPVECIRMVPVLLSNRSGEPWLEYTRREADHWRALAAARRARLIHRAGNRSATVRRRHAAAPGHDAERARIRAEIRAAVDRTRARKRRP